MIQEKTADIQQTVVNLIIIQLFFMFLSRRKPLIKIIIAYITIVSTIDKELSVRLVSLSASQFIPAHGLEKGGTVLYVSVNRLIVDDAQNIRIYFGPHQCKVISQISTGTIIACKMTPMISNKQFSNIPITIHSVNSPPAICSQRQCLFSYDRSLTFETAQDQVRILSENAPIMKLTCTGRTQYDNGGDSCASCEGIDNSLGTATSNHKACNCNPTFLWSYTTTSCNCPKNSIISNGKCFSCAALKAKYGTGLSTEENTCQCKSSFTFQADTNTCNCTDANSFITTKGSCFSCTQINVNGTGQVDKSKKTCACKPTYIWNPNTNACLCLAGSIVSKDQCFLCSKLKGKNGTGVALSNGTCQCLKTYVFLAETNTCVCPFEESYAQKGTNECISCMNVANSTQKANIQTKVCICNSNYIWNPAKNKTACLCPDNSFVLENDTCFSCTSFRGKNGTGLVNKTDGASCECIKNLIFKKETLTCQCPDTNSYIDKTKGLCVSCTNIGNGTGQANTNARKCNCKDSYVWSPNLVPPSCICIANSIIWNDACFSCASLKNKNSTGVVSKNDERSCECTKNFIFKTETLTCECPDSNSYIDKTTGMCVSCTGIGNGTGQTDFTARKCRCKDTYIWTTTQVPPACLCLSNSFILSNGSCFSCSSLRGKNATGLVNQTDGASCQCSRSFVFRMQTGTCECPDPNSYIDKTTMNCISCTGIGNGTNQANRITKKCNCKDSYVWTPNLVPPSCVCATNSIIANDACFSCASLKNKNSSGLVNKTDGKNCECTKNFIFKIETLNCECSDSNSYIDKISGMCVSCTGIGNGTGDTDTIARKCRCKDTYVWTPTLIPPACVCPLNSFILSNGNCFSCSPLRGKNATGLVNQTDGSSCQCSKSFVFVTQTGTCECPDPNSYVDKSGACVSCTGVGNGTGDTDIVTRKCICKQTYVWTPNFSPPSCLCPSNSILLPSDICFTCSILRGKNGTGSVNTTDPSICGCSRSFVFNKQLTICQCPDPNSYVEKATSICVSCTSVGNGTGETDFSTRKCICKDSFVWVSTLVPPACVCPSNSILLNQGCFSCSTLRGKNASGLANQTDGTSCQCSRSFVFRAQTATCECPDSNSYIDKSSACVSCTGVGNGTGETDIIAKKCVCKQTYVWTPNFSPPSCLCPTSSILLSNDACFSCLSLKGQNSPGTISTTIPSTCECSKSYIFNIQTNICECPGNSYISNAKLCISCSSVQGGTGEVNAQGKGCVCNENYTYNSGKNMCLCLAPYSIVDGICV